MYHEKETIERAKKAFELKEKGVKLKEIGAVLGVSAGRARQLDYIGYKLSKNPLIEELSYRARGYLKKTGFETKEEVFAEMKAGGGTFISLTNADRKTLNELAEWAGADAIGDDTYNIEKTKKTIKFYEEKIAQLHKRLGALKELYEEAHEKLEALKSGRQTKSDANKRFKTKENEK